jgi:hypothetical protein
MKMPDSIAAGQPLMAADGDRATAAAMDGGQHISIAVYENEVPDFVEAELERLYAHLFSSLARFSLYSGLANTGTYVVRRDGQVVTLLLFKRERERVVVLNEMFEISEEEVRRFARVMFNTGRSTALIVFTSIRTALSGLPCPYQCFNACEDFLLTLPETAEQYRTLLGKNMRRNVKRYTDKLRHDFPTFRYRAYPQEQVNEAQLRELLALHLRRMNGRQKVSAIDEQETQRLLRLVRQCDGLIGIATIEDRICGGEICCRIGSHYFMLVIAHDPAYDDYWLGTLCYYLTICECIGRGGKYCHFLWGRYDYKYRLLGVQQDLDRVVIYRSRLQWLRHIDTVCKIALNAGRRQAGLWVQQHPEHWLVRLAKQGVQRIRSAGKPGVPV